PRGSAAAAGRMPRLRLRSLRDSTFAHEYFTRAIARQREVARGAPADLEAQSKLALLCLGDGRYAEAETLYREIARRVPDDPETLDQLAACELGLKDPAGAAGSDLPDTVTLQGFRAMSTHPDVFIVGAARTPIGKFLGALSSLKASDLGAIAIKEAMRRAGVSGDQVDEVLMGHVIQGGQGQAPARQAQLKAGIDPRVGAVAINKVCGSGLKAVMLGAQAIKAGDAQCVVSGGMESMSTAPHYLFSGRTGQKLGDTTLKDGAVLDGLWCAFNDCHMIELAQYTADKAGLTREELDERSAASH